MTYYYCYFIVVCGLLKCFFFFKQTKKTVIFFMCANVGLDNTLHNNISFLFLAVSLFDQNLRVSPYIIINAGTKKNEDSEQK